MPTALVTRIRLPNVDAKCARPMNHGSCPSKAGVFVFTNGLDIIIWAVVLEYSVEFIELLSSEERPLGSLRSETAVLYRAARRPPARGASDV